MKKDIVYWPDPILNTKTKDVSKFSELLHELVEDMFDTMYANNGIGLAANQIGKLQRVIVLDTTEVVGGTIKQEFINPIITPLSSYFKKEKEGCLSFPGTYVSVNRHPYVKVTASDKTGQLIEMDMLGGIDAICLQHEVDHLDGITFYDRLSPVQKQIYANKFRKLKKRKK